MWNSFVIVAPVTALLDLFARAASALYISFGQLLSFLGTAGEREVIDRLYDNIAPVGFSDTILTDFAAELLVLPVHGVQWNDLGEPTRVLNIITQLGLQPKWLAA